MEQRDYLVSNNGIKGLEVVAAEDVERARDIFYRDGFVAVKGLLTHQQLSFIQEGCDRVIGEIMQLDEERLGNRGSVT